MIAVALAGAIAAYWRAVACDFGDRRTAIGLGLLLGALCLTRPDGPLFTVAIAAAVLLRFACSRRGRSWSFLGTVIGLPLLCYAGQLGFRLAYYGEWVPNTALVKLSLSSHHLLGGTVYLLTGALSLEPALYAAIAFVLGGLVFRSCRDRFLPLALMLLLWLAYVAAIGGDSFPAHRHFVPVVVVLTFALAEGATRLSDALRRWPIVRALAAAGLLVLIGITVRSQFENPANRFAIEERWEWQGRSLALTLRDAFGAEQPLLAVTAAGCLPYWTEFPCIDMLGLNDYYLPRHKPADMGQGAIGHELGDGDYVLQRAPDLIVFNVGSAPGFRCGRELNADPRFHRDYASMVVKTHVEPRYSARVWFRKASDKIGYRRKPNELTVPAYLLNAFDHTSAYLDDGRLVVAVVADQPVGMAGTPIPEGAEIEVESDHASKVRAEIERTPKGDIVVLTTTSDKPLPISAITIRSP